MEKKEYLIKIKEMIEKLSKNNFNDEVKAVHKMVDFRKSHSTAELQSLRDVFYFLNGIMFTKGLSDYWNGRTKGWASDVKREDTNPSQDAPKGCGKLFEQKNDVGMTKCKGRTLCPDCEKKSKSELNNSPKEKPCKNATERKMVSSAPEDASKESKIADELNKDYVKE